MLPRFALIVPTLNGGSVYRKLLQEVRRQTCQPDCFIVVDSGSTDGTLEASLDAGARVISIWAEDFNHGATRMQALDHVDPGIDLVMYLTQDAVPAEPESFERLVSVFADPRLGAAFGRQLPRDGGSRVEAFSRAANYREVPYRIDLAAPGKRRFEETRFSNSFSIYRITALREAGGFPGDIILGEDVLAHVAILSRGWVTEYVPAATVRHSHDYSIMEEFRRYFDIGVMHHRAQARLAMFGRPHGKGRQYLLEEARFAMRISLREGLISVIRSGAKFIGYRLGLMEAALPRFLKRQLSMHWRFWR
jgi:rhamnosyltransferase